MSGLRNGWAAGTFGTVAEVQLGKMLDKAKNKGEPTPYLRNINVRWGAFDLSELALMRMTADEQRAFAIQDGDIMVCEGGEPGRAAVWRGGPTTITFQKALMRLRPAGTIEPDLLQAFLRHVAATGALSDHFTGTTIKHLPQNVLRQIQLPVPPLAEQRRIVAKLDALTARTARVRADLDRIPALAARYKRAVLEQALGGAMTAAWRAANGVDLTSWRRVKVADLAKEVRYGTAAKCHFSPSETPVLRIPNIAKGRIDVTNLKHATFDDKERAKLSLEPGDILVIRSNGSVNLVGRAAVATDAVRGFLYAGYLIRLRLDQRQVNADYLQRAFEEPSVRSEIESFAKSSSGVHNINSEQLKSLSVPLPQIAEQAEIVRRIDRAFTEIDRLTTEAVAARRLVDRMDQAVLAKAFRGELVPQDLADEPASALLDRVHAERADMPKAKRGRKVAA